MEQNLKILKKILLDKEYSMTHSREVVFNALSKLEICTMNELVLECQSQIDRASVYRNVDLFEKLNIVNKINIGWKYKIELSEQFSGHHHHAHCSICGRVIDIADEKILERAVKSIAKKYNISKPSHSLEIYGTCEYCVD